MSLGNYVKETRGEMRHVSWPTREQTINFTALVIGVALVVGALLGLFDLGFTTLLKSFIF